MQREVGARFLGMEGALRPQSPISIAVWVLFTSVLGAFSAHAEGRVDGVPGLDASAIVSRAFRNLYGFDAIQKIEIRTIGSTGRDYTRTVQVVRRGTREESLNRMLVRFLEPTDLRGIGLLLLERPDFSYDAFIYQPIHQRVRRLSLAQRKDRFYGTDIFFEDLESKRAAQWSANYLRRDRLKERTVTVIELKPKGVPSAYDSVIGWFDHELPILLRLEMVQSKKRVKTIDIDPSATEIHAGHVVPQSMVFRSGAGSETRVRFLETEVRKELPDDLFTTNSLEKGSDRDDLRRVEQRSSPIDDARQRGY